MVIHRAASDLRCNLHFHSLSLDGAFAKDGTFFTAPAPSPEDVEAILRRIITRAGRRFSTEPAALEDDQLALAQTYAASLHGERHRPDDDDPHDSGVLLSTRRKARIDAWDLDAEVAVHEHDRARLEHLARVKQQSRRRRRAARGSAFTADAISRYDLRYLHGRRTLFFARQALSPHFVRSCATLTCLALSGCAQVLDLGERERDASADARAFDAGHIDACPRRCDGECVDPWSDTRHCGVCGHVCGAVENGTSECSFGICTARCDPGWGDCARTGDCDQALGAREHCAFCDDGCEWDCEAMRCADATAIAIGGSHACAVRESGELVCWGRGDRGELGDGEMASSTTPVRVPLEGVRAVAIGGSFTCALAGGVYCWGDGARGQLGGAAQASAPVAIAGLTDVNEIAAGAAHACAIVGDGSVRCWGANDQGQLGDRTRDDRSSPVRADAFGSQAAIALGAAHTCALSDDGLVSCWGDDRRGQAAGASSLRSVIAIAAGAEHSCAVRSNGEVWCWGANESGQLGDGTTIDRRAASRIFGLSGNPRAVTAGDRHTCIEKVAASSIACWGANESGQLGDGVGAIVESSVGQIVALAAGGDSTCAVVSAERLLYTAGRPLCWGANDDGQLGDGTLEDRASAGEVSAP